MSATTPPIVHHLTCYQGAEFESATLTAYAGGSALNLTGATIRAQVRDRPLGTLWFDLTAAVVVAASGTFNLSLTAAQTQTAGASSLRGVHGDADLVYDVEVAKAGVTYRTHTGRFRILAESVF